MSSQVSQSGGKKVSHSVPGDLVRPRYSPGLILEDSDLTAAVDYTRDLSRLLFRSLFGCGVVCGLRVGVEKVDLELKVTVAAGLALDGCGDPIHLISPATIRLGSRDGVLPQADPLPKHRNFWVVLCGGEKHCAPRDLVCDADELDSHTQQTRIRSTALVSIVFERPKCLCQCEAPPADFEGKDEVAYYRDRTKAQLAAAAGQGADCHKQHEERTDCASDGGCGAGCDCGCCVLLARVHWFDDKNAWGAVHRGERRFLRPTFGPDPLKDEAPAKHSPAAAGEASR